MAFPGTPVGQLFEGFRNQGRGAMLPQSPQIPQVMSPTHGQNQLPQGPPPAGGDRGEGSGTQTPVHQTWFMLADIIRLRRGDMEATAERVAFEQQEWANSRHYQEALHQEFAEASEALRSELTVQATQAMDYYVQEENAYYRAHVRSLEHQMEARIAHDRSTLQQEFLHQTAEVQVRAAAAETAHAQLWEEHRLYTNEANAYQQHEQGELRRELRDAAEQHGLEVATVNSLRQLLERERALQETNLRHQAEEWRQHSEAITESATEEINYQRQELSSRTTGNQ